MAEAAAQDEDLEVFQKLKDSFEHYAPRCLMIRTKEKGIQPFHLNDAQLYIHKIAEQQLADTGRVRIIVLKGRQQGMSTYIAGRFYWKTTHNRGQRAHIQCHDADATSNIFGMVKRFHEHCPDEVRPRTDRDSGKELNFDAIDSGYKVSTAGTKGAGRSSTIQYLHGSEVAYWPQAETHATGLMQAVPATSGEVFLESTSDGMGNYFHQTWVRAVAGLNGFIPVFIPWFWQSEYTLPFPEGTVLDDDELEYQEQYEVSNEHMLWRRQKIAEFKNGQDDFKREYPATPQEAFESAGYRQLIPAEDVSRAIQNMHRRERIEPRGPLVMGVDPSRFGDDRLGIALRQGRVIFDVTGYSHMMDQMEITGIVKGILDTMPIDRCFIDIGMGVGVIDRLHEMGYEQVQEVDFGSGAFDQIKYVNRRNEMWGEMADWFADDNVQLLSLGVDDLEAKIDAVTMDVCGVEYKFNSRNVKVLEEKDHTKARLGISPDLGDAPALTFAEPVAIFWEEPVGPRHQGRDKRTGY